MGEQTKITEEQKQKLKKYAIFTLMAIVFVGCMWLIFAPSEEDKAKEQQGIGFNVLALGAVNTEMLQEAFPGYEAPLSAKEMADYIYNFALTGNKYYNGKVLQVSSTTP